MSFEDFVFAWEGASAAGGPWTELRVVRFEGEEAMSRLFRYELHLLAQKGEEEPDPESLIGKRASLRIATQSEPAFKVVHGIITEANDEADVPEGAVLRVVIEPPLARARYRTRCRIFLDKTLRQIVETVLRVDAGMALKSGAMLEAPQGGSSYAPAREHFTWRIAKGARLDNRKARPYVVQYNESDLDFVARLLEEEGVSYHFEHSDDVSLLVLSDTDAGRPRVADDDVLGPGAKGREIRHFRVGGRLRSKAVRLGEHNWEKPSLNVDAEAKEKDESDLAEYVFPGSFHESAEHGAPLAQARLDRLHTESTFATGEGAARVLSAGAIFTLEHPKARYEGEYLATRLKVRGHQEGVLSVAAASDAKEPFHVELECACRGRGKAVSESRFRPPRRTPRPRIHGTQTAFVTAEPSARSAEINIGGPGSIGCVRLKFHWDTEEARLAKEPSSTWVRVSQPFARGGQGGVWHPRVGCEVIVEFEEGDPDRPVVTGRVYNGKNRPPRTAPTHSSLHSLSTPGGGVRNEISFEDTAGSERIYMNAGKDMTASVGNNRVENVGADALMNVGADNMEQVGANQATDIGANDSLIVGANQTEVIGGNRVRIVGGNRPTFVGANEVRVTGANNVNVVGASLAESVGSNVIESYGALRKTDIAASFTEDYGATRDQKVSALALQAYGGNQTTTVGGCRSINAGAMLGVLVGGSVETNVTGSYTSNVGALRIHVAGGPIVNRAPSYNVNMALKLDLVALKLTLFGAKATAYDRWLTLAGLQLSVKRANVGAGDLAMKAVGTAFTATGPSISEGPIEMHAIGILIQPSGMHVIT